jgi:pimeloyl-ACP methyl ester carboxylesterase
MIRSKSGRLGTNSRGGFHPVVAKSFSCFRGRILLFGFFAGLGVLSGGCASYGRRLALPAVLQGQPASALPADPSYEIVPLQLKDGTKIAGWFGRAEPSSHRATNLDPARAPTVIFFYGSKQHLNAPHNQRVFRGLRAMGVNVFIPEYPGNGMSEGSPSESGYYATADAALDHVLSRTDLDRSRIIAAGQSLGSGPAVDLASRRALAGLITVGGFTNAVDTVQGAVKWMPGWLARSLVAECRFDNLAKIKSVSCPILLVYGERDTLVPPGMADRLASAALAPVTKLPVPTSHNSLWKSPHFGLNAAVRDWIFAR